MFRDLCDEFILVGHVKDTVTEKDGVEVSAKAVSYTHLDVYKRQAQKSTHSCMVLSLLFTTKCKDNIISLY